MPARLDSPEAVARERERVRLAQAKRRADPIKRREELARSNQQRRERWANDPEYRERKKASLRRSYHKHRSKRVKEAVANQRQRKSNCPPDVYTKMLVEQEGLCFLCNELPRKGTLHADHDHETGRVRRLLCDRCNLGLEWAKDDPALLRQTAEALEPGSEITEKFRDSPMLLLRAAAYVETFQNGEVAMYQKLKELIYDQSAVTAIEYALIAALISVAAVTVLTTVGGNLSTTFNTIATKL